MDAREWERKNGLQQENVMKTHHKGSGPKLFYDDIINDNFDRKKLQ